MDFAIGNQGGNITAKLSGQFTFSDNQKFKSILDLVGQDGTKSLQLDFHQVEFIDSAGLGMLLLLRDHCQGKTIPLTLQSAHGQVEKIFTISKFDQLFSIQK